MSVDEKKKWYLDVLSHHSAELYSSLIYEHDLSSNNLKEVEFEKSDNFGGRLGIKPIRGYFANKNKRKYFIEEQFVTELPLKIGNNNSELLDRDDVIIRPLNPAAFRIKPEPVIPVREMIDNFAPFEHSNPPDLLVLKFVTFASIIGKTFVCLATTSSFGKSSFFDLINYITDKCPVFKPRSVPGILNHINGDGNMVFDETHRCKKDVRDIIEEFALQIGGGKSTYINGALKSANTKQQYDCRNQSITFLYNLVSNYTDPEKEYFEFIFSNNKAIDDRFLKFRLDGALTEKFRKNFNIPKTANDNKMYYVGYAKTIKYLQQLKAENGYARRWVHKESPRFTNRHRQSYEVITWLIDIYAFSQEEYDDICEFLNQSIIKYREMIAHLQDELINTDLVQEGISVPVVEEDMTK